MQQHIATLVLIFHILTAILMAWPFYVLVLASHRSNFGPSVGGRLDLYLEDVIHGRALACFVFQASALVSGLALIRLAGGDMRALLDQPLLGAKFLLLLLIAANLIYVYFWIHPRIVELLATGEPLPPEVVGEIGQLRRRRKRQATLCLFLVLVIAALGVQLRSPFPYWLNLALLLTLAAFVFRAYRHAPRYGWV